MGSSRLLGYSNFSVRGLLRIIAQIALVGEAPARQSLVSWHCWWKSSSALIWARLAYAPSAKRAAGVHNRPYAFVRHPMYSAIIMWCVSVVMVLPGVQVALVSAAVAVVIVVRTALEDAMLARELPGYAQYRGDVRWRLIPFVW